MAIPIPYKSLRILTILYESLLFLANRYDALQILTVPHKSLLFLANPYCSSQILTTPHNPYYSLARLVEVSAASVGRALIQYCAQTGT